MTVGCYFTFCHKHKLFSTMYLSANIDLPSDMLVTSQKQGLFACDAWHVVWQPLSHLCTIVVHLELHCLLHMYILHFFFNTFHAVQ